MSIYYLNGVAEKFQYSQFESNEMLTRLVYIREAWPHIYT